MYDLIACDHNIYLSKISVLAICPYRTYRKVVMATDVHCMTCAYWLVLGTMVLEPISVVQDPVPEMYDRMQYC